MCAESGVPPITPDLTIGDLLRHYPALGESLGCLVPAYGAMSPPVRDIVGRTLTLHRLAESGGVPLGTLITGLRAAAGLGEEARGDDRPAWTLGVEPAAVLDARPILAAGEHPLGLVMQGLSALEPGQVYEMLTPFVPGPLVEMARSRGFEAFAAWEGDTVRTFFRRTESGAA